MGTIGINPVALQALPAQGARSAPVLPRPSAPARAEAPPPQVREQSAEQQRVARVQQMARDVANVYVVSDRTFTIFKDTSGQYITRFTSLRDGRVTYIPEPDLIRLSGSGARTQTVSIEA